MGSKPCWLRRERVASHQRAGQDTDTDTDTEADTDTDTDTDSDAGSDTDSDSDTDTGQHCDRLQPKALCGRIGVSNSLFIIELIN